MEKKSRHGSMAEQLAALKAYRSRPEAKYEPMQTTWRLTPSNDNTDPEAMEGLRMDRRLEITPSIHAIMKSVATGDICRNEDGQIIGVGDLSFSDGNQTEAGYVLGIDGDVIQADIRMPAGAMLKTKEKADTPSGSAEASSEVSASNAYFSNVLGTIPHRYKPGVRKRKKGKSYTQAESAQALADAYANTDMDKVTYTRYPKGLPCGSPKAADSFIGMRKTTCAGGGGESWEDTLSAMIDRKVWLDALQELKDKDREILDAAMDAANYTDVGIAAGQSRNYADKRSGGRKALIAANDNLAAAIKKHAA
ncbi:hypothetical protein [Brucella tritici]|uniref:hypothetical protein n=1 Tax=Brucella tritici TaxID=94626 RepID=UPI003D6D63EC